MEGALVEGLYKVEEYSPRAFSGSHSKPAALVGVCRVGHRLFDVDMSPPLKQSVDALTRLRMGGDVEEIGINFVELLFAGDDMEAIRIAEVRWFGAWIKAIDLWHAKL